jgi:hypothetical protein
MHSRSLANTHGFEIPPACPDLMVVSAALAILEEYYSLFISPEFISRRTTARSDCMRTVDDYRKSHVDNEQHTCHVHSAAEIQTSPPTRHLRPINLAQI